MATVTRRALAISWAMPPLVYPRALQVSRTLKCLGELGWQVSVICADAADVPGATLDERLAAHYDGAYLPLPIKTGTAGEIRRKTLKAMGLRVETEEELWEERAVRMALRSAVAHNPDLLMSFAQPWSDHVIALRVHEATGVFWVAHFSDPWVDSPYYASAPAEVLDVWRSQERRVAENANLLAFTCHQTAELVMAKYPAAWRARAIVVPHTYSRELAPGDGSRDGQRLSIVHTGDLYGPRVPEGLLAAFRRFVDLRPQRREEVRLISVGAAPPEVRRRVEELDLGSTVTFTGRRPFTEAMMIARDADVALLIDADSPNSVFLPSKLADYMMLCKPILGVTPAQGASADLLRRLGCVVVPPDDVDGICRALDACHEAWRAGTLAVGPEFAAVAAEYEASRVTERFASAINDAMNKLAA